MSYYGEDRVGAYHEAGHATATVVRGGRVERVTLDAMYEAADFDLDPWSRCIMLAAGAVSARLFTDWRSPSREMSSKDGELFNLALEQLGRAPSSHHVEAAEQEAKALLLGNDRVVHELAHELLRAGEVSGAEVHRIVGGRGPAADVVPLPVPAAGGAVTVSYRSWPLRAGGFAAAVAPLGRGSLPSGLETTAGSEDAAIDALGEKCARELGRPVALVPEAEPAVAAVTLVDVDLGPADV